MKVKIKSEIITQPPKIWHKKPGDVVRLLNNDDKAPDLEFYMIISKQHETVTIFNLRTNESHIISCSIRCEHYDATLNIDKRL